ncbi:ATP-binding cassette domain-containing protein [Herbaspirillum sp. WKF16]|uniref:methionine ABC transporter ATP-binding protein n=1 Tax=Herbaspirillum sp. WKF16 TaxID=3028312 RepID=UPI0023AA042F|nr:ATP-binding cassette domain-containing protein [Herbaspirillum sp. WKF16]WDZ98407.1 ATP-binding cassette domain-containing protein [Herbaspirillum sp. WKF16]
MTARAREDAARAPAESALPSAAHIAFQQVSKQYPGPAGQVHALREVSFEVRRGEIFGVIGRSGAGKSTLLRTINALELPGAGMVKVNGADVGALDEDGLVALRRRVGMIFQHFNLLSAKTVRENVGLPLRVAGVPPQRIREKVDALLALVGLADKADAYPARLSGGQKQRVGIARALVHEPDILLCDEATSALDPETTQSILALLRDVSASMGLTVVLITHDMAVIREICDRVLVLDQGQAVELGEVWRVFGNPQADATRALLRPLQHGVPADLAEQLVDDLQGAPGRAVLSLRFTGAEGPQGVSLQDLARLGPDAALLHGGLDRIRGHAQGELLLALPAAEVERVRGLFKDNLIKVIGYVPARA